MLNDEPLSVYATDSPFILTAVSLLPFTTGTVSVSPPFITVSGDGRDVILHNGESAILNSSFPTATVVPFTSLNLRYPSTAFTGTVTFISLAEGVTGISTFPPKMTWVTMSKSVPFKVRTVLTFTGLALKEVTLGLVVTSSLTFMISPDSARRYTVPSVTEGGNTNSRRVPPSETTKSVISPTPGSLMAVTRSRSVPIKATGCPALYFTQSMTETLGFSTTRSPT